MLKIKATINILLVAMAVIFAIQNATTVEVQFLFWSLSVPRALLVVVLLAAGFIMGITISCFSKLKNN
jgi:uncharacterized integral membrane protein